MLQAFLFSFIFCFTGSALALGQQIEIDSKLFFHGKKVASPRILTTTGERAKIVMNDQKQKREYNLEVLSEVAKNNKIELRYSLAVREDSGETISRGVIKVPNNEKARISLDHGRIQLHLKIKKS